MGMGKHYESITQELTNWMLEQHLFFVATAPLAETGLINCSPKGMDTFRVLSGNQVAYLDLTGSGIETVAHLKENGRIVFMFCAFEGPPKIVRLHGKGESITPGSEEWEQLSSLFPVYCGARAIIRADIDRVSDSCGYAVPKFEYNGERDTLLRHAESLGEAGLQQYRNEHNARSLEDLQGLEPVQKEKN